MSKRHGGRLPALLAVGLMAAFPIGALGQDAARPAAGGTGQATLATSCVACHGDPEWFDEESIDLVREAAGDVHGAAGIGCHDCHGGNPDPALADDDGLAMSADFAENPYLGTPERTAIPAFCGRCHSDPRLMHRFQPRIRVDQEEEYRTSRHGEALAAGDERVATCVDCHGVHGILGPGNPDSLVHPARVAETCASCHADPAHMAGSTLANGEPLPTDQYGAWRVSAHARALLEKGDLSAPTCNDCHGNHGAVPPGVESIAFVCGHCHGREAGLFRSSTKQEGFVEHNDFVDGMNGCSDCHESGEPQAALTGVAHFTECATCHGNHAVISPRITMLSPLPATPCAVCHEPQGELTAVAEPERSRERYEDLRDQLVSAARNRGLEGKLLFDDLVEQARVLPPHTHPADDGAVELRPEVERLFEKFRLGTSRFSYDVHGETIVREVLSCGDCHGPEPTMTDTPLGFETSREMIRLLQEITSLTARAERILLRARRGGVATLDAQEAIDQAIGSQIELQVLVHAFAAGEGSAFRDKHAEGMGHAEAALVAGQSALDELDFRRRGLLVSLVVILLLLAALGAKIRQISAD